MTDAGSSVTVTAAAVLRIGDASPQRLRNTVRAVALGAAWLREGLARETEQKITVTSR